MEKKIVLFLLLVIFSFGCTKPPITDFGPGDYDLSIRHEGLTRTFKVHVPLSYEKGTPTPLVLNFHGGGGDASGIIKQTKMNEKSDSAGFIVVYPQGTGKAILGKIFGTWNAGRCCGHAKENNIDDVGFVKAMIKDLESKFSVDEKRIFSTGHSNGALMSYRLACELSDTIAAIAPNAAHDSFDDCNPTRPISIIHFHGTADPAALYEGGHCGGRTNDEGWECSSVPNYIEEWRVQNNCPEESTISFQNGDATCNTYSPCDEGSEVTLCTITGAGHTWPGGNYYNDRADWPELVGPLSNDIIANDEMWKFFQKHPMQ